MEFSEISLTVFYDCHLGNIRVLSIVNPGLPLIWLQKNSPDYIIYVKVGS